MEKKNKGPGRKKKKKNKETGRKKIKLDRFKCYFLKL